MESRLNWEFFLEDIFWIGSLWLKALVFLTISCEGYLSNRQPVFLFLEQWTLIIICFLERTELGLFPPQGDVIGWGVDTPSTLGMVQVTAQSPGEMFALKALRVTALKDAPHPSKVPGPNTSCPE